MRQTPGIDIVTRLYDLSDLPHLDQLVFSVMAQSDAAPLQLHVMLQRFSFDQVQAVREATWGLRRLHDRTSLTLHNWDYPAPFDLRVPLLNWGVEVARGRYVTCLDVHDQLCPDACAALLARLHGTQAALALGGVAFQPVTWWGDVVLPVANRAGGSAPAPVFMADRSRLATKDCVFRNGEPDPEAAHPETPHPEIKEFIERLRKQYAVDTMCQSDILAVRRCPL